MRRKVINSVFVRNGGATETDDKLRTYVKTNRWITQRWINEVFRIVYTLYKFKSCRFIEIDNILFRLFNQKIIVWCDQFAEYSFTSAHLSGAFFVAYAAWNYPNTQFHLFKQTHKSNVLSTSHNSGIATGRRIENERHFISSVRALSFNGPLCSEIEKKTKKDYEINCETSPFSRVWFKCVKMFLFMCVIMVGWWYCAHCANKAVRCPLCIFSSYFKFI